MEEEDWSKEPSLPKSYTSLLDLEARWMKKQQQEKERLEKERHQQQQQQQQTKDKIKELQPQQQNQQLVHLHSNNEEQEGRRRTSYKRSNEVDSRPNAYTNRSDRRYDWSTWRRSRPQVVGCMYRSYGGDWTSKQEVLAYEEVATEERKSDEPELMNKERKDYESRREKKEGEVKGEVERESLPVVVSSIAMTDRAMKLRAEIEEAGVAKNPRADSKGTVRGRREENVGRMHVPVGEKEEVEEGVEVVRNPRDKRKRKVKARGKELVGEMHVSTEKKDAVKVEVESKEVQVVRNTKNNKKEMVKAREEEIVGEMHLLTEEDAKKDDSVIRKSSSKLKVKSGKEKKKEGEISTVVEVKEKDVSVVGNFRNERTGVKRENGIKRNGMVENKVIEVKVGLWKETGNKIRAESESVQNEAGVEKKKMRNLSMQYRDDLRGINGTKGKPAKDNESNIKAEIKSLKDEDGVVEENMRNGEKIGPGKKNESEIRAESEVWKNGDVAVEEKLRNGMKIEQGKESKNKIRAEIEVSKDEVGVVEEKLIPSTMPYGNDLRGGNGMKTKLGKERSLKTEVGEVGEKLGGFTHKPNGWRGGNGIKRYNDGVHWKYRNSRFHGVMSREKKNSGGEMVWVKKEDSGNGKIGGTRTSSLD